MTDCGECLKTCELHGVTFCSTCHKHPGECGMGDCETPGVDLWEFFGTGGVVMERRLFCSKHSTHPHFGWLRKGGKKVEG